MKKLPVILGALMVVLVAGTMIYKNGNSSKTENGTSISKQSTSLEECETIEGKAEAVRTRCDAMGRESDEFKKCDSSYWLIRRVFNACLKEREEMTIEREIEASEKTNGGSGDRCKDLYGESAEIYKKCKSMDKKSDEYKECAELYKAQKTRATYVCHNGRGLDENGVRDAVMQWEKQVDHCKGSLNNRCATALQQLGHYQFQLEKKLSLDHKKSFDYFLKYIETYPDDKEIPGVLYQMATISNENGESKKANEYYKRIINEYPDNGFAYKARFHIGEY